MQKYYLTTRDNVGYMNNKQVEFSEFTSDAAAVSKVTLAVLCT